MPGNNFEEDVRKKMEELRFVPSGDVWNKVEENIRADRKRRRFIFWLPLAGLLVGGLVWFAWPVTRNSKMVTVQPDLNNATAANAKPEAPGASSPSLTGSFKSDSVQNKNKKITAVNLNADIRNSGDSKTHPLKNLSFSSKGSRVSKSIAFPITNEADYLASVSQAVRTKKHAGASGKLKRSGQFELITPSNSVYGVDKDANAKMVSNEESVSDVNIEPAMITRSTGNDVSESTGSNDSLSAKKDSLRSTAKLPLNPSTPPVLAAAEKKNDQVAKKHKIEWGVTAMGGISAQMEKNVIPADVLARAYNNSTVYVIKNSELNAGPAFSLGIIASKQIGKTWRLQSGISYAYYSSKLPNAGENQLLPTFGSPYAQTGIGVNAFAPTPYKSTTYSNRYQFIQVPLVVEKNLGFHSPLSVQAGVAFGYLSGIHAVIYQPLLDQYWQDNTEFNKFQMTGLAGVYWKIKLNDRWSLRAGPEVQYQLTNLMKSSVSVSDHLLTGGMRIILLHFAK